MGGILDGKVALVTGASRGIGAAIALELWDVPVAHYGAFVAGIPAPLSIGTLRLEDGRSVQGFLCEAQAALGAQDITQHGGWRAYLQARR